MDTGTFIPPQSYIHLMSQKMGSYFTRYHIRAGDTVDVLLRHTWQADGAVPLAGMYIISWWGIQPNTHAQCAVPFCSTLLALQLFSFLRGKQNSKSHASETARQGPCVQLSGLHS